MERMEEKQLTIAQLARFMGKPVQYEACYYDLVNQGLKWQSETNNLTPQRLLEVYERSNSLRNLRLILRPVASITDEEAAACFKIVFGSDLASYRLAGVNREEGKIEAYAYKENDDRIDVSLFLDGEVAVTGWSQEWHGYYSPIYNATALIDYLDSRSIDTRGYLENGLAIAHPTPTVGA